MTKKTILCKEKVKAFFRRVVGSQKYIQCVDREGVWEVGKKAGFFGEEPKLGLFLSFFIFSLVSDGWVDFCRGAFFVLGKSENVVKEFFGRGVFGSQKYI